MHIICSNALLLSSDTIDSFMLNLLIILRKKINKHDMNLLKFHFKSKLNEIQSHRLFKYDFCIESQRRFHSCEQFHIATLISSYIHTIPVLSQQRYSICATIELKNVSIFFYYYSVHGK